MSGRGRKEEKQMMGTLMRMFNYSRSINVDNM